MTNELRHFLLVFDRVRSELLEHRDLGTDAEAAMVEYARVERQHMAEADNVEIVLIGSDSLDTVKVTHANYFGDAIGRSGYFAGIARAAARPQ